MSRSDDRIAVPTNGHRPPSTPRPDDPHDDAVVDETNPSVRRRGVAIDATPTQLAVVAAIVASLVAALVGSAVALLVGATRRRRG